MSNTLYVFVDESGNPTDGDYYVVAGSWCVSNRDRPTELLLPTVESLRNIADSQLRDLELGGELKGSELPPGVIETLISTLTETSYEDTTITKNYLPWGQAAPIRHSIHEVNPDLGLEMLDNIFGTESKSPMTLKTMALASVLNPLFADAQLDDDRLGDVHVVLDADVWQNPVGELKRGLGLLDSDVPDVEFTTAASDDIPGLQIADLTAYSWARELRQGDCSQAARSIHDYRFSYRQER